MESHPTIEQFIYDCFQERTSALKRRLEIHQAYRRRFYRNECLWDSHRGVVEKSEGEKIVGVSLSDTETSVVTTGCTIYRSRYRVIASGGSWSIQEVDMECAHCQVSGVSTECTACGGTGWVSWKDRASLRRPTRGKQLAARIMNSPPEEEPGIHPFSDPAIEAFMTDHFRERTAVRKREFEIYAEYAKQFYSPECDWTRWVQSVQGSEAERILSVAPVDTGAHVITSGSDILRLRYHLRPAGESWLIWEVDPECLNCLHQGRSATCFWCGGTIWDRRKSNAGLMRGRPPGEEPPPENPRWQP